MSLLEPTSALKEDALLANWCRWANARLKTTLDGKTAYFGNGHNHWGVQTNQKALAGFATAGLQSESETYLDTARNMLRFSLETHHSGNRLLLDGGKWGHCWYSALGIERMMHVIPDLEPVLTPNDHDDLRGHADFRSGLASRIPPSQGRKDRKQRARGQPLEWLPTLSSSANVSGRSQGKAVCRKVLRVHR